ncbi:hypothetical protein BDQ17DRAFT_1546213 [Cyathus striatus]|nr:hypothetical protein BDQ17DRAFT_1546213 [Cyathus striatus]
MSTCPAVSIDQSLYVSLNAFKFVQVMTLSVLTWEIVTTLPMEMALYRRGFQWTYAMLSFSRYYSLACLILDVALNIATGVSLEFCNDVRWVLPFLSSTIQFASVPLLLLRTYAIWGKNKSILPLLIIFWIAPMAIGIYVCTTYSGVPYSLVVGLDVVGGCANDPHDAVSAAAPFIANSIVDSCVLFLTLGRLIHLKGGTQTSLVRRLLIRDGLLYYIVVVVINVLNLVFFLAPGLLPLVRPLIATPASIAPTIMVGRLFFNLQYSFMSADDSVSSGGSRGSSNRHRIGGNASVGDNSRALYPLQPIQVAYSVNTSKHTDDIEHAAAQRDADASSDMKRRPVIDYP